MQCQNKFSPIVPVKLSCIFVSVSIQTEKKTEQTTIHHFSCHRKFWDETNRQAQKPFLPLLSQVSFNSAPNKKEIKNSINTVDSKLSRQLWFIPKASCKLETSDFGCNTIPNFGWNLNKELQLQLKKNCQMPFCKGGLI